MAPHILSGVKLETSIKIETSALSQNWLQNNEQQQKTFLFQICLQCWESNPVSHIYIRKPIPFILYFLKDNFMKMLISCLKMGLWTREIENKQLVLWATYGPPNTARNHLEPRARGISFLYNQLSPKNKTENWELVIAVS